MSGNSANGVGELYTYLPPTEINLERLRTVPSSHEISDYGFSIGRGAWTFDSGRWMSLAIRVRLNDVGIQNGESNFCIRHLDLTHYLPQGEIEIFIDGRSVLLVDRVVLCEDPTARICAAHFQTFFGGVFPKVVILIYMHLLHAVNTVGHTQDWASPRDQKAWISSISGAVVSPTTRHDPGIDSWS